MAKAKPRYGRTLWDDLQEVYDTYLLHSFTPNPPQAPLGEHWKGEGERAARVLFGMPTLSVALYRVRDTVLRDGWPLLPYFCELLATGLWHVSIGRKVTLGRGLVIPHGHVVIDGKTTIGRNCVINPWVTIGLSGSRRWGFDQRGPVIGDDVYVGTGAKVLGPITVGEGARIGANAVVIDDVPAGATVVGAPARVVHDAPAQWPSRSNERGSESGGHDAAASPSG
jgi:serine O-acetyltransferase